MRNAHVLVIVSLAMLLEAVDTTILNTAIPVMARSLHADPVDLKLALISYLLSLAIFIPISGWIADTFGIKRVFLFALTTFTLSSIWCGFTHNLFELIIARCCQGIGGSLALPLGRLIIVRTFPRSALISKMSTVVMIASLGMMLGPLLGGLITTHFSWRWIFWVNIPIGIFAICLTHRYLEPMPPEPTHPLDKVGFVLFGSGLSLLTLGLSVLSETHDTHFHPTAMLSLAVGLLTAYIWHSRKNKHPIINIELLQIKTFRIGVLGNLFSRFGFGGMPFLLPLLLQISLGFSSQLSGFLLAPVALGVLVVKPFSWSILRFFGYKKLLLLNTTAVSISLLLFASITTHTSVYWIGFLSFLYGFLIALQYTAMNSLAYACIQPHQSSAATSIMSTIQQVAQSIGVAVAAIILRGLATHSSSSGALTLSVFQHTFTIIGILTFLSTFIFIHLGKEDGQELIQTTEQG